MHLRPHRYQHLAVAYQEEGAGSELDPAACVVHGRDGEDEASITAIYSLFSGANARARLEEPKNL